MAENSPLTPPPVVANPVTGQLSTPPSNTLPTNAIVAPTLNNGGGDLGLNSSVRTFINTQATTNQQGNNIGIALRDNLGSAGTIGRNLGDLYPPTDTGVGQNDDAANPLQTSAVLSRTVTGQVNSNARSQIVPQGNVLDRFASYTYRASVYVMSPQQVEQYVNSQKRSVASYQLLFQSGGAPTNVSGFTGALNAAGAGQSTSAFSFTDPRRVDRVAGVAPEAGRSPAFDLDFFIDSITIKNNIMGTKTLLSQNIAELKFTVVEPYGITLVDRLYQAVQDTAPKDAGGAINYGNAHYLMVIRFYGYDINGNLQRVGSADPSTGLTDPDAAVEKFVLFQISKLNWSVQSKITTYEFECAPLNPYVAAGSRRGTIPYDMSLAAGTVKDILAGSQYFTSKTAANEDPGQSTTNRPAQQADIRRVDNAILANASEPSKANAARQANLNLTSGLMQALNEFVADLTKGSSPVYGVADEYAIEFLSGAEAIRDASLVLPGRKKESRQTPVGTAPSQSADGLSPDKQSKDISNKSISLVAGQPVVQVIDNIIRNSSYIYNQQLTMIDADTNQEFPNPKALGKPVNWYHITFKAVPIKYDRLRNDYAYKITYYIGTYLIDDYDSKYFPIGTFRGVHKSYPYWFTGANSAVIDYSESFNNTYHRLVSGSNPQDSLMEIERRNKANTLSEMITYTYSPTSGQSGQQTKGRGTESMANLADSLYDPDVLFNSKIKIIGDPSWIQQGSINGGIPATEFTNRSFLPDGTINFDAEQVFYEVTWQRPADYDLYTGLAAVGPNSQYPQKSRVYRAISVTSEFRQGKFETTVEGSLFNMPKPDGSNKAPGVAPAAAATIDTGQQAEIARNALPGETNAVGGTLVTNTEGGAAIVYRTGRRSGIPHVVPTVENGLLAAPTKSGTPSALPPNQAQPRTNSNDTIAPQSPAAPVTSDTGQNISLLDRFLNRLSGQTVPSANQVGNNRLSNSDSQQPTTPQSISKEY
jgi:hypothetical protein